VSDFDPVNNGVAGLDGPTDERLAVVGDMYEITTRIGRMSAEVMDVTEDHIVVRFTKWDNELILSRDWQTISTADFRRMADKAIRDGAKFTPAK